VATTIEQDALGNCYEDAGNALSFGLRSAWSLIHGRPQLRRPPWTRYGHAWLEAPDGETCWDPNTDIVMPKLLYYALGNINEKDNFKYNRATTVKWITKTRHWGPWEGPEACAPLSEKT